MTVQFKGVGFDLVQFFLAHIRVYFSQSGKPLQLPGGIFQHLLVSDIDNACQVLLRNLTCLFQHPLYAFALPAQQVGNLLPVKRGLDDFQAIEGQDANILQFGI